MSATARDARAVAALAGIAWAYTAALWRGDYGRASQVIVVFQTLWSQERAAVAAVWSSAGRAWPAAVPMSLRADGRYTTETRNAMFMVFAMTRDSIPQAAAESLPTSAGAIPRWHAAVSAGYAGGEPVPATSVFHEWNSLVEESPLDGSSVMRNIVAVFEGTVEAAHVYGGGAGGTAAPAALPSTSGGATAGAAAQREIDAATATPGYSNPFMITGRGREAGSSVLPWLLAIGGFTALGFLVYWMVRRH